MSFSFVIDTKRLEQKLTRLERRVLPQARIRAMNDVAFQARGTVQKLMPLVFDAPTPFTIRSPLYRKATDSRPVAEVFIRDDAAKGTPPSKYLQAQVRGGQRRQKGSERLLERAGVLGRDEGWVPSKAVRLNKYGNLTGSRLVQILSQAKAFGEVGYQANITSRSKKRNASRKQYFVPRPGSRLPRGVYERYGPKRRKARPVLLFVKLPTYRRRLDFEGAVRQDIDRRLPNAFSRALRFELRRAGIRG